MADGACSGAGGDLADPTDIAATKRAQVQAVIAQMNVARGERDARRVDRQQEFAKFLSDLELKFARRVTEQQQRRLRECAEEAAFHRKRELRQEMLDERAVLIQKMPCSAFLEKTLSEAYKRRQAQRTDRREALRRAEARDEVARADKSEDRRVSWRRWEMQEEDRLEEALDRLEQRRLNFRLKLEQLETESVVVRERIQERLEQQLAEKQRQYRERLERDYRERLERARKEAELKGKKLDTNDLRSKRAGIRSGPPRSNAASPSDRAPIDNTVEDVAQKANSETEPKPFETTTEEKLMTKKDAKEAESATS
eukprot:TRINITY_DN10507_c0_g1_i1.p1 TRINITY_DN10507_c0_g1~~TRINITY_DN10507_c0_g1_i1.p1  ORF type:complete len:320 (+),score=74.65 TRINITY_DN10507_c0_g1_i1:27-962(+)